MTRKSWLWMVWAVVWSGPAWAGSGDGLQSAYLKLLDRVQSDIDPGECSALGRLAQMIVDSGEALPAQVSADTAATCESLGFPLGDAVVGDLCQTATLVDGPPFVIGPDPAPDGSEANPWPLCTASQLAAVAADDTLWGDHFLLEADIDLTGYAGVIGNTTTPFAGTFDGGAYTLSNLSLDDPTDYAVGLFGVVAGTVRNLSLVGVSVVGNYFVGGLVGIVDSGGSIEDIPLLQGTVDGGQAVGGLAGESAGNVSNAHTDVVIVLPHGTTWGGGGLVGWVDGVGGQSTVSACSSAGSVSLEGGNVGGLVGSVTYDVRIEDSSSTAAVGDPNSSIGSGVGGLVGTMSSGTATILGSQATGNVSGYSYVGGLVGKLDALFDPAGVYSSSASGSVSGFAGVGGLVGGATLDYTYQGGWGRIEDSFATGPVICSGALYTRGEGIGGLVGNQLYGPVEHSWATGGVTAPYCSRVGGLAGSSASTIDDSWAGGDVQGDGSVGGLVGSAFYEVTRSGAFGDVTGSGCVGGLAGDIMRGSDVYAQGDVYGAGYVGGLAGCDLLGYDAGVSRGYAAGVVSPAGSGYAGGFLGHYTVDPYGTYSGTYSSDFWNAEANPGLPGIASGEGFMSMWGVTDAQLRDETTYTEMGWDFTTVWTIPEPGALPVIIGQGP